MRFKTNLKNVRTFSKLTAALSSLEKIAWMRLDDDTVRFTVIPDQGSQVWASLSMDHIFDSYQIQSAEPSNTINLELPLVPLQRALKSAVNGTSASLRLTKKDGVPLLSMTIMMPTSNNSGAPSRFAAGGGGHNRGNQINAERVFGGDDEDGIYNIEPLETHLNREREKIITQDIPVRVLHPEHVEMIMQPKVREPDVHIQLPSLMSLKAISDRFTKLAVAARAGTAISNANATTSIAPKLEIAANMHGSLRLSLHTDTLDISSQWDSLENPELDPVQLNCPLEEHPSTKFREEGPDKWATVRVDGKDWSKVLSVGRLEGRVIACFADEHALIMYVYVPQYDEVGADDSVVTYYVSSYSV
ncbi:putative Checkpoint protein [Seiridium unicorne]|uniref:Checkpoint protein n=1 Tax=Seiridium unicorne TaxID=138068 RepID=A0ABR2UMQ0_9PEZI